MRLRRNTFRPAVAIVVVATAVGVTGGHWQILQSVAWVKMLVEYSRSLPMSDAVAYTFDGQHPCEICKVIEKAKQSPEQRQLQGATEKSDDLFAQSRVLLLPHGRRPRLVTTADAFCPSRTDPPPVPPPRNPAG